MLSPHASFALLTCLILADTSATSRAQPAPAPPFTFVRITDTHIGNAGTNVAANAAEVEKINLLTPRPEFVVNCGDLVDEGTADQYKVYQKTFAALAMPCYSIPGNHDVRWAPLGKESIQDAMHIPLFQSFDRHGCHFVLLDSTVTLEHWGHFDAGEMNWLKRDLAETGRETPVFIFMHHWVGRDAEMVDNEGEFIHAIEPYNVKIVFCGHGHADIQWRVNGVQYIMDRGLYQGSFDSIAVTPETVTLSRHRKETAAPQIIAVIPTHAEPDTRIRVSAKIDRTDRLSSTASGGPLPSGAVWQWRADSTGPWQPMLMTADGESASVSLDRSKLSPGRHQIEARLSLPMPPDRREEAHDQGGYGGDDYVATLPLLISPAQSSEPAALSERWRTPLGGGVQSKLVYDAGVVYVSCVDGALYALGADNGKIRWKFQSGGSLYGAPRIDDGRVYIGSMDHFVYAIDTSTGKPIWKTKLGGPVFAGVQIADGIACVGTGDRTIYGLDPDTGKITWTYQTNGFIQQRAAAGDGAFYVGAWDNGFYALEAKTGALRWKKSFGRNFFYSPAIGAPTVYGGRVYVPSNDDTLHAVDMRTGDVVWEVHAPDLAGSYGYSGPAITPDGHLYMAALGGAGSVMCLDPATGGLVWRTDTGGVIYDSSCAAAGGVVTIGSVDGAFHALDGKTGALLGTYRLGPGLLLASPAMSADGATVFIGSLGNAVYALAVRKMGATHVTD